MAKQYRDFKSAREFVRSLNLETSSGWRFYSQSGNKPDDIPKYPLQTYKNDWKGTRNWLGIE